MDSLRSWIAGNHTCRNLSLHDVHCRFPASAASSAVSENLLKGMFSVNLTEKRTIHVARATVLFIAVIAVFLAGNPDSSVFGIVSFAWAGFGAVFRTGGPCGIILETFQQERCSCRHDRRRSHGICMEILRSSVRRVHGMCMSFFRRLSLQCSV